MTVLHAYIKESGINEENMFMLWWKYGKKSSELSLNGVYAYYSNTSCKAKKCFK